MSFLHMAIGLPGTGKSSWLNYNMTETAYRYSTDDVISDIAFMFGRYYDEIFSKSINLAIQICDLNLQDAIEDQRVVVWDQTNLTIQQRARKLRRFPKQYYKIGYVFMPPPDDIWKSNLDRPGKTIPDHILVDMMGRFEYPTLAEGFDDLKEVQLQWK